MKSVKKAVLCLSIALASLMGLSCSRNYRGSIRFRLDNETDDTIKSVSLSFGRLSQTDRDETFGNFVYVNDVLPSISENIYEDWDEDYSIFDNEEYVIYDIKIRFADGTKDYGGFYALDYFNPDEDYSHNYYTITVTDNKAIVQYGVR